MRQLTYHSNFRDIINSSVMCKALVEGEFVSVINRGIMDRMVVCTPAQTVCDASTLQRTLEKLIQMSF